jgi:tetratricopeptide (TPR) repeat protein
MEKGDVVLFCGAGFSFDATNEDGQKLPLGKNLSERLANLAHLPYTNEPLPLVYQAVRKHLGSSSLNSWLKQTYKVVDFADWYKIIGTLVWHRIYTTNIDDLINCIFRGRTTQTLDTIVCPAQPDDRDPHFKSLQCIHLHGYVHQLEKGLTFTLQEFAQQQTKPNPWYQILVDDVYKRPVVFIGSLLEESSFHYYLSLRGEKQKEVNEYRPNSFLVNPNIGKIRSDALQEQNITPIECTGEEFLKTLALRLADSDLSIHSICVRAFPHVFTERGPKDESIIRFFDPIYHSSLPSTYRGLPDSFFMGAEPSWRDIADGRDGQREATEILREDLALHNNQFQCIVLFGPAGSGKTTVMKRAAIDLSKAGKVVYYAKSEQIVDFDGIIRASQDDQLGSERLYVFVDNFTRHIPAISKALPQLTDSHRVTLILADRTNAYARRSSALLDLAPLELEVKDLTEAEVHSILQKLEQFRVLGVLREKTYEERVHEFMIRASRQLLVAMQEATRGIGFEAILTGEYNELVPEAKLAYTICCLAVAQGAQGVYRRHLLPCLGRTSFTQGVVIEKLLRGVLVPDNDSGTLLRPRHRSIAQQIVEKIAPSHMKYEAVVGLLKQISSDIVPNAIKRRTPPFRAYRGLINCEGLTRLFGGDHDTIISIYEELRDYYGDEFLFWLQYAMAHIAKNTFDTAENYLHQALTICESVGANPFQIKHQQGILYILQAIGSNPAILGAERAKQGIILLESLIQERGDIDSYSYNGYTEYIMRWYVHAGALVSNQEWESLRKIAQLATKKFARDEMARENRDKIERAYLMRLVKDGS